MTDHTEGATAPAALDEDRFARYAVRDRREILQLMRALIEKRLLLSVQLRGGPSFLTVALAVSPDDGSVILDASADEAVNALVGAAYELVCTTRLDNVRVQFSLQAPARARHDERPALRAALPERILRLQRREFFRLPTPHTAPPHCVITFAGAGGRKKSVSVRILDISGGGVAVLVPPQEPSFEPGAEFDDCRLQLPDGAPLPVRLIVRNLFEVERPNAVRVTRAGCEFIGQSTAASARIQRYIFSIERDRKARESG